MDRVRETLQLKFPEWYAAQRSQEQTDRNVILLDDDPKYREFTVCFPWVLRPNALAELFDKFEKKVPDAEIRFELRDGMLKIRCAPEDEGRQTSLLCKILDSVVISDDDKLAKVVSADDWNTSQLGDEMMQQFEPFCTPRSVVRRKFRGKWDLPHIKELENFTVSDVFPNELLVAIQEVTGTILIVTPGQSMVWIGADTEREVAIVKKKLTTLINCWALGRIDKTAHFFLPEKSQGWMVAFRFLGHVSSRFLSTFFLDRDKHPTNHYTKLFKRGVGLCALSWDPTKREFAPIPLKEVSGTSSNTSQDEPFKAFSQWEYPAKNRSPSFMDYLNMRGVSSWVERLDKADVESSANPGKSTSAPGSGVSGTMGGRTRTESTIGYNPRLPTSDTGNPESPARKTGGSSSESVQSQSMTRNQEQSEQPRSLDIPRIRAVVPKLVGSESDRVESRSSIRESSEAGCTEEQDVDTVHIASTRRLQDPGTDTETEPVISEGESQDILSTGDTYSPSQLATPSGLPATDTSLSFEDPFRNLFQEAKLSLMIGNSSIVPESHVSSNNHTRGQSSTDMNFKVAEKETRELHNTMRQNAGSRNRGPKNRSKTQRGPTSSERVSGATSQSVSVQQTHRSELVPGVNTTLVDILKPLRAYVGKVSVKAQLGRFSFMNVTKPYVLSNPEGGPQHCEPATMKNSLNSRHSALNSIWFTSILTTEGSETNLIANIKEADGTRMWNPLNRRAFYVFPCTATTATGKVDFFVEVDASNFNYRVQLQDDRPTKLFMHCLVRYWDFQLTVSATPNLQQVHETFAKDLVSSLAVTPNPSGPPKLEFAISRGYRVEILTVRTRNVASYARRTRRPSSSISNPQEQFTVLELSEVHDMDSVYVNSKQADADVYTSERFPGNMKKGQPPMWIEACIQSKVIHSAFQKNETLELGDEAAWSPEELRDLGAFDDLVTAAADTVKQIDAVGYWCDNGRAAATQGSTKDTYKPLGAHAPDGSSSKKVVFW